MMGDFNYPDSNWLQQTVEDNAGMDCKEFFTVLMSAFLLNMWQNIQEVVQF